jgi:hypothetical protein
MKHTELIIARADSGGMESSRSAVRWGAVMAGAMIAGAVSAMLVLAGTGLGFLAIAPWSSQGLSGSSLAAGSVLWLLATQIIAYGVGGYVTGRLRIAWTDASDDEIFFRDTVHGFLVWAFSVVISVVLLGSMASSAVSGTVEAGAVLTGMGAVAGMAGDAGQDDVDQLPLSYFSDMLLRPGARALARSPRAPRREVARILARSMGTGRLSDADRTYLTGLVEQRTGLEPGAARQRVLDVEAQVRQALLQVRQQAWESASTVRREKAAFSLWAFISLMVGAFVASLAATLGGRDRLISGRLDPEPVASES